MLELPNGDKITFDFYIFERENCFQLKPLAAEKLKNKQTVYVYGKFRNFGYNQQ